MKKFIIANLPYLIVIILLNAVIYANSLSGQFVSDDYAIIFNNEQVKNWTTALTGEHRHIQYMVWGLSLKFFGANPFPMHLVALSLHIINAFLLYILISRAFSQKIGFYTTLLFSAHPINTEAISWISASIYLYLTFFLVSSLVTLTLYRKLNEKKYLYITYALFVSAVVFTDNFWNYIIPPILIVFDQTILSKEWNAKKLGELIPVALFGALIFFISFTGTVSDRIQSVNKGYNSPFLQRIPYSVYMHAELLLFPKNLTLYHEGEIITQQKYQLMIAVTVLIVIALPILILMNKKIGGLILLTYLAILPVFSPIQVAWFIADRYLYIPSAFFCLLVVIGILNLQEKYKYKNFVAITLIALLAAYSARTIIRNVEWQTPKKLWLATERVGPNSPRVHNNLGDIYAGEKNFDASIWHFKKAVELQPYYADAIHNLGNTYLQMGNFDEAEKQFLQSLEINPYLYPATYKLGLIAYQRGNLEEARGYFEQTLAMSPKDSAATKALELVNTTILEKAK